MFEDNNRAAVLCEEGEHECVASGRKGLAAMPHQAAGDGGKRILLPRGSAETRFAPPQYYYLASKTGVLPSWAVPPLPHCAQPSARL